MLSIKVFGRYRNRSIEVHLLMEAKGKALYCETVSCWLLIDPFMPARGVTCSKAEIWLLLHKCIFLSCTISMGSFNSDGDYTSENTWKSIESKQWRSFSIISGQFSQMSTKSLNKEINNILALESNFNKFWKRPFDIENDRMRLVKDRLNFVLVRFI